MQSKEALFLTVDVANKISHQVMRTQYAIDYAIVAHCAPAAEVGYVYLNFTGESEFARGLGFGLALAYLQSLPATA